MRSSWFLLCLLLAACSSRTGGPPDVGFDGSVVMVDSGSSVDAARPDAGPALEDVLIYAHSADTLYSFSPATLTVTEIGVFLGAGGAPVPNMLDLAVDRSGAIYTASADRLWRVSATTAQATEVGSFGLGSERLYALSFLAPGEYGSDQALVGATDAGAYYVINPATGTASMLGQYPDGWLSSGDIVSVEGLGTFATVKRADYPSDVLVQILFAADGTSTASVKGPIRSATQDFVKIFGVGYWGRVLYGFSDAGELIEIDRDTGAAQIVSTTTGATQFWGAGVTTRVPVLL